MEVCAIASVAFLPVYAIWITFILLLSNEAVPALMGRGEGGERRKRQELFTDSKMAKIAVLVGCKGWLRAFH